MVEKLKEEKFTQREESLLNIGTALSTETNLYSIFELILRAACELTCADAGTIYSVTDRKTLKFEVLLNTTLNLFYTAQQENAPPFDEIPLYEKGQPCESLTVTYAVHKRQSVRVQDVYNESRFDFSSTRSFDERSKYHTKAVLVIPLINHEEEIIGLLQLINPIDSQSKEIVTFSDEDVRLAQALASQGAVALSNRCLIEDLKKLFHGFVRVIAQAVDELSPATYGHGERVPVITMLIAKALNQNKEGPLSGIKLSPEQLEELHLAALLHDCGKISTPQTILERKGKLEAIIDRMELIELKFSLIEKELECAYLKGGIEESDWQEQLKLIREGLEFAKKADAGVHEGNWEEHLRIMAEFKVWVQGKHVPLITQDELEHLLIPTGNLTTSERKVMQRHVELTHKMLNQLEYPKTLENLPMIASTHHERMNGQGYPWKLRGDEIPFGGRVIAIADVFEALSAPDRSYKQPWKLSKVLDVMSQMAAEGHFDQEIFSVFMKEKVYESYAKKYLKPDQVDI